MGDSPAGTFAFRIFEPRALVIAPYGEALQDWWWCAYWRWFLRVPISNAAHLVGLVVCMTMLDGYLDLPVKANGVLEVEDVAGVITAIPSP